MSSSAIENVEPLRDGGQDTTTAKTRFMLKVTDGTDDFIARFALACNNDFKSQLAGSLHQDNIRTVLSKVDVDQVLAKDAAYSTFKASYGIKKWLTAPEEGVRGLLRESLKIYGPPLQQILDQMHTTLIKAAKSAMKQAGKQRRSSKSQSIEDETTRHLLLDQALKLVDEWRDQTWDQLSKNLHAEAEFPAPERFEFLKRRLQALLGAEASRRAATLALEHKRQLAASLGLSLEALQQQLPTSKAAGGTQQGPKVPAAVAAAASAVQDDIPSWSEFYMGWLEKCSRRGVWQRRWFALSVRQQRLWYFGHPEEQPARGTVDLKGAMLIASEEGAGKLEFRVVLPAAFAAAVAAAAAAGGAGAIAQKATNNNSNATAAAAAFTGARTKTQAMAISLRAGSASSKEEWLDMLNKAIAGVSQPKELQTRPTPAPLPLPALDDDHHPSELSGSSVERKISTKIFSDNTKSSSSVHSTAATSDNKAKSGGVAAKSSSNSNSKAAQREKAKRRGVVPGAVIGVAPSSSEEEEEDREEGNESPKEHIDDDQQGSQEVEEDEEERRERELKLFEEIAQQAEEDECTEDEWRVLECVCKAVREYVQEAQVHLTEQASKIIADGMLPVNRADELHSALLKVLKAAGGGGGRDRFLDYLI